MQIIVSGSLAIDQIMFFDGLFSDFITPETAHQISFAPLVQDMQRARGGTAGNITYSLALLQENPILLAAIGKDQKSYMLDLEKNGVNISAVHFSDSHTATFSVMTDTNNCQIGGFYPGAMSDSSSLSLKPFKNTDVCMIVAPHDPVQMKKQVLECKEYGIPLIYDIGQQVTSSPKEDLIEGITTAKVLIVNEYEMGILIQRSEMSKEEILATLETCIITKGEAGSDIYSAATKTWTTVPACTVKAQDPTGAGDAYRAGFLYGYVRNWDVLTCAQLGSVTAAFAVEKQGTQHHSFSLQDIEKRYTDTYKQPLTLS